MTEGKVFSICNLVRSVAFISATFLAVQVPTQGQNFNPGMYQTQSKTAGIQEAIDAASKVGGGTVQIPAGTFVLHAAAGHPAILLRSRVSLVGAGSQSTILKLEVNPKIAPAVMVNQNYADPDAAEADHDIRLQGFTVDASSSEQVLRETQLQGAIATTGEQDVILRSMEGIVQDSLLRVDPGPDEEIVPALKASAGSFRAFFLRPHPAGAKVLVLVPRLHGLALVGASNVSLQDVTFRDVPMDGIYLTSTVDVPHRTYSKQISIHRCHFVACHRNGISVIDADDVSIANNDFSDITGDPGAPVDVEPNRPDQHGNRINIAENEVHRCYRGITVSLQFSGPTSQNFHGITVSGNTVEGTLYGWGIYVLWQQAGATVTGNTVIRPAGDGILVVGSANVQVTNNKISDPGRCHTRGNCRAQAFAAGIRLMDDPHNPRILNHNVVSGNTIEDVQETPSMLYGVDFSSKGGGNTIQRNVVSRFDPKRGAVVHVGGSVGGNKISDNSRR